MKVHEPERANHSPLLVLEDVYTHYDMRSGLFNRNKSAVKAVDGVSLSINEGETLGLVGESGSGKSTLGRTIAGLETLTSGHLLYRGEPLNYRRDRARLSREIQMVFQDPYSSLNPRHTVGDSLIEPLIVHRIVPRAEAGREVDRLLSLVGLPKSSKDRYPHEFSGGQRQRISIARALAMRPKLLICDEPVSALDVSIQAQIMNLFKELQRELGLTYLFIAHGLGAVKYISNRIAVMYKGKIVELGSTEQIFRSPQHDYTRALLNAYPVPNPRKRVEQDALHQESLSLPKQLSSDVKDSRC